jgi:hypothetical protein
VSGTHANNADAPKLPKSLGIRQLEFLLADDVVVAERFASSFASAHTDFDEKKAPDIVAGKTRCERVIALMATSHGARDPPGGRRESRHRDRLRVPVREAPAAAVRLLHEVAGRRVRTGRRREGRQVLGVGDAVIG